MKRGPGHADCGDGANAVTDVTTVAVQPPPMPLSRYCEDVNVTNSALLLPTARLAGPLSQTTAGRAVGSM
jgi:hypothetical protein